MKTVLSPAKNENMHFTPKCEAGCKRKLPCKTRSVSGFAHIAAAALRTRREHLSAYEQGEIGEYPQIWYCGDGVGGGGKKPGGRAKKPSDAPGADLAPGAALAHNHGFDDERGDYGVTLRDHLAYRYEILEIVGKGSFGKVLRCFDHRRGRMRR